MIVASHLDHDVKQRDMNQQFPTRCGSIYALHIVRVTTVNIRLFYSKMTAFIHDRISLFPFSPSSTLCHADMNIFCYLGCLTACSGRSVPTMSIITACVSGTLRRIQCRWTSTRCQQLHVTIYISVNYLHSAAISDAEHFILVTRLSHNDKQVARVMVATATSQHIVQLYSPDGAYKVAYGSLGPCESTPKWHLNRFSHYMIMTKTDRINHST